MKTLETVVELPLGKLVHHPDNPRKAADYAKKRVAPLGDAMEENGTDPLIVRAIDGGKYEVCVGNRRMEALEHKGEKGAPCIVREMTDFDALCMVLANNMQHEAPDPFLEARAIGKLLKAPDATLDVLSKRLGMSVRTVARRRELLNIAPSILEEKQNGNGSVALWPVTWFEAVVQLDPVMQERWFKEACRDFVSLEELEASVGQYLRDLGKAPFDLADEKLFPKAGSCAACPKQSANERNAGLFGLEKKADAGDVNKATCRDAGCYKTKLDRHAAAQVRSAVEKDPEIVALRGAPARTWDGPAGKLDRASAKSPKGLEVLPDYGWKPCAKDDRGAKKGVVISGPLAGRTQWYKKTGDAPTAEAESKGPIVKQRIKQMETELQARRDLAFADAAVEVLRAAQTPPDDGDVLALAAVVGIEGSDWKTFELDHAEAVIAVEGKHYPAFIWPSVQASAIELLTQRWSATPAKTRAMARICIAPLIDEQEISAMEAEQEKAIPEPPELTALRTEKKPKKGKKAKAEKAAGADDLRLCDDCSGESKASEFDKCECGHESCAECHEIHAETCEPSEVGG